MTTAAAAAAAELRALAHLLGLPEATAQRWRRWRCLASPAAHHDCDSLLPVAQPSRLADAFAPCGAPAAVDLLGRLLAIEPDERCTCAQALRHPFFEAHLPPQHPAAPPGAPCAAAAAPVPTWGTISALTEGCDDARELLRLIRAEAALCGKTRDGRVDAGAGDD